MASDVLPGAGTFPSFVSVTLIDIVAMAILVAVLAMLVFKFLRVNPTTAKLMGRARKHLGTKRLAAIFVSELVNRVMLQRDIINDRLRRSAHLCMFWGFVGLSVTTTADYLFNRAGDYIPFFGGELSWIRLLGNASGAVMILGTVIGLSRLLGSGKYRARLTFSDAWFASLLLLVGVSGFVAEYFGEFAHAASPSMPPAAEYTISMQASLFIVIPYGVHLVLIALLFITAPLSAFIHAVRVPSLRYVDRVGDSLAKKISNSQNPEEKSTGSFVQNSHRSLKEEAIIEQIKSHYEFKLQEEERESEKAG
ncbi:MAG: respiratory nitrate reductase subunit gamma [Nitrososphaerota archaeon]|nr:respiratory nitrate reductase subunit gamma [Nitrososphaerota archaeon]